MKRTFNGLLLICLICHTSTSGDRSPGPVMTRTDSSEHENSASNERKAASNTFVKLIAKLAIDGSTKGEVEIDKSLVDARSIQAAIAEMLQIPSRMMTLFHNNVLITEGFILEDLNKLKNK